MAAPCVLSLSVVKRYQVYTSVLSLSSTAVALVPYIVLIVLEPHSSSSCLHFVAPFPVGARLTDLGWHCCWMLDVPTGLLPVLPRDDTACLLMRKYLRHCTYLWFYLAQPCTQQVDNSCTVRASPVCSAAALPTPSRFLCACTYFTATARQQYLMFSIVSL